MQFAKLRLSGFKSFVDSTELVIENGLTGVVGPNGCGKSNLVEALQWVMGETSAKQMRGSGMEDVIFGGTATRPARNIAEVIIDLDNGERKAPAHFNEFDELEVSRRIEREKGSNYRVNGKDVRARDVQLLFADSATGARSTALVSQGRIGEIISAKPTQRRHLLEEAAGITGLHSRRHEAELRLRGAETNLERLDDVMATMESQMANLRKQARQATRYRNLSDHIRKADAALYAIRWSDALDTLEAAREAFKQAEGRVVELTRLAGEASTRQAEAATAMPDLRKAEAAAAAEMQRLRMAREALDEEEKRVAETLDGQNRRVAQLSADIDRERRLIADANEAVTLLEKEKAEIAEARAGEETAQHEAKERLDAAAAIVNEMERELSALTEKVASDEARRNDLGRRVAELTTRKERLQKRTDEITAQRARLENEGIVGEALAEAENMVTAAQDLVAAAREDIETAEAARNEAHEAVAAAIEANRNAEANVTHLEAEERALAELLEAGDPGLWPPLIDSLSVEPGYEAALGAALGEDLSAPTDEAAPVHWRNLPPYADTPSLPDGAEPLGRFVQGGEALRRRIAQIGVVADPETGARLMGALRQGQRLVSRDGGLWRWDGLIVSAGTPTAAAARLQQRNRLKNLREEMTAVRATAEKFAEQLETARAAETDARTHEQEARDRVKAADASLARARDTHAEVRHKAAEHATQLKGIAETELNLTSDMAETDAALKESASALESLPDSAAGREKAAGMRAELAERRATHVEAQSAYDYVRREMEARINRLATIERELVSWAQRKQGAEGQLGTLAERQTAVQGEIETLSSRPAEIEAQRHALLSSLEESEARRRLAADTLSSAEGTLAEVDRALREAEAALSLAREERVRTEAAVEQGKQTCRSIAERVTEKLDCKPEQLREIAEIEEDAPLPGLEEVERRVQRLDRERETMGPVNLRAEHEQKELAEQLEGLETERSDLIKAIEKLRRGIAELNREGRQRLLASFAEVDRHFQELFVRLFGGGRAHLQLTESDDPLEAGLEIMASPPGKRLQSLSLLSGGEQALTALALLFGVFLT
ncbi:MAG: AAA family ATPase, partial [Rhodospirillales bacterium]|nr:AAA family ATPase [Rhodospirillales bacterium]